MSKTTTYSIETLVDGEFVEAATRSAKASAIALSETLRVDQLVATRVVTSSGTVVHETKAPGKRVIRNKTAPWTRVDDRTPDLAPGVKLPKGFELTYLAPRNKCAVVRHPESLEYLVVDLTNGEQHPADNCRDAGAVMKAIKAGRTELVSA